MIVFEYMDEEEKKLYRSIYNQKNLESVDLDYDGTYVLDFYADGLIYSLKVSSRRNPNLNLEYLKSLDEEDFFDRIVDGAKEKHTISKEDFKLMIDDWMADHAYEFEDDADGELKIGKVKRNEDEEEEWELEAYAEDNHHAYIFTDYYEDITLNSLNTSF